jgi:CheY-like chemotaxis protein
MKTKYPNGTQVLVIDDSHDDIYLLQIAARKFPAEVSFHHVQDVEQAKNYLSGKAEFVDRERNPLPDLILLDLNMPHTCGFEFLHWLSSAAQFKAVKVLVWTGSDEPAAIARAKAAGATRVIRKPNSREGLMRLIGEISRETENRTRSAEEHVE